MRILVEEETIPHLSLLHVSGAWRVFISLEQIRVVVCRLVRAAEVLAAVDDSAKRQLDSN